MPTIAVGEVDIYHEVHGSGDPVLLIAGFACDHTIWAGVVPALATHHRVLAFDNRGTGRTPTTANIDIHRMAEDAAGLLAAIEPRPVHVVGHSMGGMIAQELAINHPEMVRTLTLIATCSQLDDRGKAIVASWGTLPRHVDAETATRLILPWLYTNAVYSAPEAVERLVAQILGTAHPPSLDGIEHQSRAIIEWSSTDRIGQLRCPTLVLVGQDDVLLPVTYSEALARTIPGAGLFVLEQTGHGLLIESPDAVAAALLEFLTHQGGPRD